MSLEPAVQKAVFEEHRAADVETSAQVEWQSRDLGVQYEVPNSMPTPELEERG